MMDCRLRVRTPARLHFGLLGWGQESRRQFGGVGLMLQSPQIDVVVEPGESWHFEGPFVERLAALVPRLQDRFAAIGLRLSPARIRVLEAPQEHIGLGVGTQFSLAVACALLSMSGVQEPSVEVLGLITGRGDRSGIGLHGFYHGGLIVDGGRRKRTGIPPLIGRYAFPEEWSVLVIQPPGLHGLHGLAESRAFAEIPPIPEHVTERLCRIVLLELVPAVLERDLPTFGAALMELQAHVGAIFSPAQGGCYTSAQSSAIVEELGRAGFVGIGQSSWGPTLYAFTDRSAEELNSLVDQLSKRSSFQGCMTQVTNAANRGAVKMVETNDLSFSRQGQLSQVSR